MPLRLETPIRVIELNPILERSEDYEHEAKIAAKDEVAIFLVCSFGFLAVVTALAWGAWMVGPWLWSNLVWLWNAGPQDSPWIGPGRWGVVTGLACMVWFCAVGFWEWWTKERR